MPSLKNHYLFWEGAGWYGVVVSKEMCWFLFLCDNLFIRVRLYYQPLSDQWLMLEISALIAFLAFGTYKEMA